MEDRPVPIVGDARVVVFTFLIIEMITFIYIH